MLYRIGPGLGFVWLKNPAAIETAKNATGALCNVDTIVN